MPILTVLKAEGHSADTGAGKFPLVSMGGRAEGLACADPGAKTPIGASGNFIYYHSTISLNTKKMIQRAVRKNYTRLNYENLFSHHIIFPFTLPFLQNKEGSTLSAGTDSGIS
jgi:hypothetical protein